MQTMTILLVDDEERFLSTTRKLLLKRGYNASEKAKYAEPLEQLRSRTAF